MGASDSKLVFKKGIFRLSEEQRIPANDVYWTSFWELPETAEDVFSLFSPADIRRTRDSSLPNLETLILAVTSRLSLLRNHPSFPDPEIAPEKDALNCVRVLTRVLPYIYESPQLEGWGEKFFWKARRKPTRKTTAQHSEVLFDESRTEDATSDDPAPEEFEEARPLAEELIDTLIDLLFFSGFTLPKTQPGKNKVTYLIWQNGVGCNTPLASTKEFENNRCEILRFLLTITSQSMYMAASELPSKGVRAITYITTSSDKQVVLSLLCSLLNTTLRSNQTAWRLPYNHVVFKDPKQTFITYCIQFLLVLLLYPVPETKNGHQPKNFYRHFFGRLHRPQDFEFLIDGMLRILKQPVQANSSYLPGSQSSLKWAPEMIMLFWEALQCNKRFRAFIIEADRAPEFVKLVLCYAIEYKSDLSKHGIVRMCVFVLQTLSAEPNFGKSLNKKFDGQDSIPAAVKIPGFDGTYTDFLIISINMLITASNGRLSVVYPALLAILNNVAAYIENLGVSASSKLLQLFASMSAPEFLLANDSNHNLLHSLLESINAIIEHKYKQNPHFIFAIMRSKKRFLALRNFTLESGKEEIEAQKLRKKEQPNNTDSTSSSNFGTNEDPRSSPNNYPSTSALGRGSVEENTAFAIGEDEDSDEEVDERPTPSQTSPNPHNSQRTSFSSSVEDAVPLQLRGMSEKARGKMPVGTPTFSRQNSTTSLGSHSMANPPSMSGFCPTTAWIDSWLPELPLHTTLTLIQELGPLIISKHDPSNSSSPSMLQIIRNAQINNLETSLIRVHLFEWSPMSLGWYESLLWGFVFTSEMMVSKGSLGVWNGTSIKLFKVQETVAEGPSFRAPRGAVDAVGSNLVQRIGSLNLRGGQPLQQDSRGASSY